MFKEILTHPSMHQDNNYVYCVYAFNEYNSNLTNIDGIKATIDRFHDLGKLFRTSLIGKLDPNASKKRFGLSENIDQTGMFGKIAIILGLAQDEQVRISWNCDLASGMTEDQLVKFVEEHDRKIMNPYKLLTSTVGSGDLKYNELILRVHSETEIQGVCYRGSQIDQYLAQLLGVFASHQIGYNIPVISLNESKEESIDRIEKTGKTLGEILITIPQIIKSREEFYKYKLKY